MAFAYNLKYFWRFSRQRIGDIAKNGAVLILGATVAVPLFSVAQGAYFLAGYRLSHGDAPHPASPSSGVVVVSPDVVVNAPCSLVDASQIKNGGRWNARYHISLLRERWRILLSKLFKEPLIAQHESKMQQIEQETWARNLTSNAQCNAQQSLNENNRPLRLFVVGDSLAVGVGTLKSGTPILPQSIARHL